jgi:single-strand DNA-binding protein
MSMNKIIIHGFLGQDPKTKTLADGKIVCQFSVATTENWKNQAGEKQSKTEWHNVVAWGKQAEVIGKSFVKGQEIIVEGKMEYKKDKQDEKKIWPTIRLINFDFCGKKGSSSSGYVPDSSDSGPDYGSDNHDHGSSSISTPSNDDDDIPF